MNSRFNNAILIDGLVIAKFSPEIFRQMHEARITAANCTCSVWHNFRQTMTNIARWKLWFGEFFTTYQTPYFSSQKSNG